MGDNVYCFLPVSDGHFSCKPDDYIGAVLEAEHARAPTCNSS